MAEYTLQPSPRLRSSKSVYDYGVEGTWTPVVTFETPGDLSNAYSEQYGSYLKIGQSIFLTWHVSLLMTFTTSAGDLLMTGLPYTNIKPMRFTGVSSFNDVTKANFTQLTPYIEFNTDTIRFAMSGSGQQIDNIDAADITTHNGGIPVFLLSGFVLYQTTD